MNALRRGLVAVCGHRVTAGVPDEQYAGLSKIGGAILFAAALAGLNFALFGWVILGEGLSSEAQIVAVILSAVVGVVIVLVVDRSMVYFADTASRGAGLSIFGFLLLRVTLILAIGAFSSQAVMPLLLKSELQAEAVRMRDASDSTRAKMLDERYGMSRLESERERSAEAVRTAENMARTLPADIIQRLAASRTCWADLAAQRSALIGGGIDREEVNDRLAPRSAACRQQQASANSERDRYLTETRDALIQARGAARTADQSRDTARNLVKTRLDSAASVEEGAISTRSSDVLWSLLLRSPGAMGKWALLTFLQVVLEMLPLLLKFNAGQSGVGHSISVDREVYRLTRERDLSVQQQDQEMFDAVREVAHRAAEKLPESAEAQKIMAEESHRIFASLAPLESMNAMMEGLVQQQSKVDKYSTRYPQHAAVFARAMTAAIQRGAEAALGGARPHGAA